MILPSHVTHLPFEMEAPTDTQLGPFRPAQMSSGLGLTGLVPRRHLLQHQLANTRSLDEIDWRSNVSNKYVSQFNFSLLLTQNQNDN